MIIKKEKEFYIVIKEIDMRAILKMDYLKGKEFFIGIMVIDMKVVLGIIKEMEIELCFIKMEKEI